MSHAPIAPSWIVLPLAMIALLVVAAHLMVLRDDARGRMPESRRQIRMITGWVMMFTIPLLAYAFGIVSISDAAAFLLSWSAATLLLTSIILLAAVDAINSVRLARAHSRKLRERIRQDFQELFTQANTPTSPTSEHRG